MELVLGSFHPSVEFMKNSWSPEWGISTLSPVKSVGDSVKLSTNNSHAARRRGGVCPAVVTIVFEFDLHYSFATTLLDSHATSSPVSTGSLPVPGVDAASFYDRILNCTESNAPEPIGVLAEVSFHKLIIGFPEVRVKFGANKVAPLSRRQTMIPLLQWILDHPGKEGDRT